MLSYISNLISDLILQIRLMFHHTHCQSNCGNQVGCECDNDGVSTSSSGESNKDSH